MAMICPSCGTPSTSNFKFCPECGERLAVPAAGAVGMRASSAAAPSPAARVDEAAQAARLLDQAFQLYDDGEYNEALGCCQASLALDPEGSTAHSLLGMIYERLGKTAEAVEQYQVVLRMNPDSVADAIKLETLISRSPGSGGSGLKRLSPRSLRLPAAAGALVAVAALAGGIWATSRAGGPHPIAGRSLRASTSEGQIPGASMPRPAAPIPATAAVPQAVAPAAPTAPASPATGSTAGASAPLGSPVASVPSPPPANAWPAPQHGGYPRAQPVHPQAAGSSGGRAPRSGYLAPAPIQGVEKIAPGQALPTADLPGPSLPAGATTPRHLSRGSVPVLPAVTSPVAEQPAAPTQPAVRAPAMAPPPSASINIQPLDDTAAARAPQPAAAPVRPPSLMQALQHQQMAAYYRRQGDDQAAYGEYQSARDLFMRIQQRGGRDAAVAAQGAVAAQTGMSRLQSP